MDNQKQPLIQAIEIANKKAQFERLAYNLRSQIEDRPEVIRSLDAFIQFLLTLNDPAAELQNKYDPAAVKKLIVDARFALNAWHHYVTVDRVWKSATDNPAYKRLKASVEACKLQGKNETSY
jgi:hypothetical protein